jgi:uncharacterized membrane protein YqjE
MQPEEHTESAAGSVRRTVATVLRILQNRVELLGLELEEEGRWAVSAMVWTACAVFFAVLAILLGTITVVMLVPESWRGWFLGGFAVLYAFLAFSAVSGVKKHFRSRRPPLADSVNELRKDLEWIQSRE